MVPSFLRKGVGFSKDGKMVILFIEPFSRREWSKKEWQCRFCMTPFEEGEKIASAVNIRGGMVLCESCMEEKAKNGEVELWSLPRELLEALREELKNMKQTKEVKYRMQEVERALKIDSLLR